jgi:hypothetical protein
MVQKYNNFASPSESGFWGGKKWRKKAKTGDSGRKMKLWITAVGTAD